MKQPNDISDNDLYRLIELIVGVQSYKRDFTECPDAIVAEAVRRLMLGSYTPTVTEE